MKIKNRVRFSFKQALAYLKDYRFNSILVKYFLLLLICLVLPVAALSIWYGNQMRKNLEEEMIKRNETSLEQVYENVNAIIRSAKNLAYDLTESDVVRFLSVTSYLEPHRSDNQDDLNDLSNILSACRSASDYVESICVYLHKSNSFITDQGVFNFAEYQDKECLEMYSENMPNRAVFQPRKKNNKYPYLLSILSPISLGKNSNAGAVIINIDVERLGDYIGSGQYRNKDYFSTLFIYDEAMENLIYSDEYRLLNEEEHFELEIGSDWENRFSKVLTVEGRNYIVSGLKSEQNAFRYLYLTSMRQFELQNQATNQLLRNILIMIVGVCLILASLLAIWVYKPIQHTMRVLNDVSMLTEWDKKEQVNEIERIQRSILSAKKEKDNLNEQIQERIISLHNAQICALQTQINPHFLYNTLEAIGNAAALLMKGDNKVTDMIYSLGLLMRISLSGENYLVPLKEELEHVELYVKLVDFRFRGRIRMHMEIPKELENEMIVKLTLQPLIENAIQHGLAHKRSQADIWIKGEKDGDKNYIHVIDNGKGVSDDKLTKLQNQLEEAVIGSGKHIGLRNVNQRLKLVFGEEYGLNIERAKEGGLCVTICYKTV